MDNLKLETDKYGLVKTSDGRYVNPTYATPEALGAALKVQNPSADPNKINEAMGFGGYGVGYQADSGGRSYKLGPATDAQGNPIPENQRQRIPYTPEERAAIFGAKASPSLAGINITTSPTISSDTLSASASAYSLPQISQDTATDAGNAISGMAEGQNNTLAGIVGAEQQKATQQQAQVQAEKTKIGKLIDKLSYKGTAQVQEEAQAEIPEKAKALNDITNEYNSKALAYTRMEEAVWKESMLTDVQKQARLRVIGREKNSELADLAIRQSVAQNNLSVAQSIVDRKIDLIYGDVKDLIQYQTSFYNDIKGDLTKTEDRIWNATITENQRAYESGTAKLKALEDMKVQILSNIYADNTLPAMSKSQLAQAVQSANTREEALSAAGQYAGDVLERRLKTAQVQKAEQEARDVMNTGNAASGEYASVINNAANLLGAEKAKQSRKDIANAIANKDYTTAFATIANNVEQNLTGEPKTKFANARTDYAVMAGMRDAVQEYADGGGDMGLLVGKEEEIKRKLGIDSGKASELAVQLWREFQTYRSNMTGAAFSAQESRDYASVNPTLGKSLDLNLSVIDGSLNQLENRILGTIETRVPGAKKIYGLVTGTPSTEIDPATAPIGFIVDFDGVKYRKVGQDAYEEIK